MHIWISPIIVSARENHQMDSTNPTKRYRVIIADNDLIVRDTLRKIVETPCEVIAEGEDGLAAIQAAEALDPDKVFLDMSMPVLNGFHAADHFRKKLPLVRIIVVSNPSDKAYVDQALQSGAQAYVLKGLRPFKSLRRSRRHGRSDIRGGC